MSNANKKLKGNNGEPEPIVLETSSSTAARGSSSSGDVSKRDTTKSVAGNSNNGDASKKETSSGKSKSTKLGASSRSRSVGAPEKARVVTPRKPYKKRADAKRKRSERPGGGKKGFDVMSDWTNYYADEETDEDVRPLLNKRTERRKRQKLWLLQLQEEIKNEESLDD